MLYEITTILSELLKESGEVLTAEEEAIAAPNVKGQILALQRCYERMAGRVKPEDIGFIEAHGTSYNHGRSGRASDF